MREIQETLSTRLDAVDPAVISPSQIAAARSEGSSCKRDTLLTEVLGRARQNPVLGAAFAAGVLDASSSATEIAQARLAAAIALVRWGYLADGFALTGELTSLSPVEKLYARWVAIISERRLHAVEINPYDELITIANSLEEHDLLLDAARCRQDAAATGWGLAEATKSLDEAHACLRAAGYGHETALGYILTAYLAYLKRKFADALRELDKAAAETEVHQPDLRAYVWMMRGQVYTGMRQFSRALKWLREAESLALGLNHQFYYGSAMAIRSHLHYVRGDIDELQTIIDTCWDLPGVMTVPHLRADILNTYGLVLEWQGDDEGARQQIAAARDIFDDLKAPVPAAMCIGNLGMLERNRGNFSRSLDLIGESDRVFEQYDHYAFHANAHCNLARTYAAFGYLEPAEEHCQEALTILSDDESAPQRVTPALLLARLVAHDDPDKSERLISEVYQRAVEGDMQFDAAMALLYRGEVLAQLGRHREALADYHLSYEKLLELQLIQTQWYARVGIAESLTALEHTEWATNELLALPESQLVSTLRWRYYATIARLAGLSDRQIDAHENYVKALQVARDARRSLNVENQIAHFAQSLTPLFREAQHLALQNNDALGALTLTELHGAQLMSVRWGHDFLADHRADELLSLARSSLNQRAGDGWTVLRYTWHGDQPGVFVITPDDLEYVPINLDGVRLALKVCTRPTRSDRRFAYLGELPSHANPKATSIEMRRGLYDALIPRSVQNRLDPDELLVIIPSGRALHGLSFQALLGSHGPLVNQATILYAQSLDMLRIALDSGATGGLQGHGLVFSQSVFHHQGYDALPHADTEGTIVAGHVPAPAYHLHGNGNSRETLLALATSGKITSYNWLHFATHAYADEETGAFTGLITGHDVLALDDIRGWELDARLVTLSACQTGMGEYYYGDEIAGLAQAFQSAHANSVVATLWLVPDDPHVVELMGEFYQNLAQGTAPAYALAQAQRNANQDDLAPYYWAAYSAFGSP